eukprot:5066235-Pleurochrysis_carterae.AAC.1
MACRSCTAALMSLAFGMTTIPRVAKKRAPSQRAQTPSVRFSGIAMMRLRSVVSRRQTRNARSARCTPTTPMIGSSVYICAKYRRCCARCASGSSRGRMRLRTARQAKYALVLSARRNGASATSMSSLKRWRIASLKRCAILDAGWVPKPSLRSDTKNN